MSDTPRIATLAAGLASIVLSPDSPRQFATVRAGDLKHPPNWIRQDAGTPEELASLARSYLANPVNYILVTPDGFVRDGNRRLMAILADSGPETPVPVCITTEEITPVASLEIMLETAEHTKALTPYEQYLGYTQWLKITGSTAKELAAKIRRNESTVSRILSLAKCDPVVHEAAEAGTIGPNEWAKIRESDDQAETVRLLTSGAIKGRAELDAAVKAQKRKKTEGDDSGGDKDRHDRVAIPMGANVVVVKVKKSKDAKATLDLKTTLALLKDAVSKAEKALDAGYGLKTAAKAWADTKDKPKVPRKARKPKDMAAN